MLQHGLLLFARCDPMCKKPPHPFPPTSQTQTKSQFHLARLPPLSEETTRTANSMSQAGGGSGSASRKAFRLGRRGGNGRWGMGGGGGAACARPGVAAERAWRATAAGVVYTQGVVDDGRQEHSKQITLKGIQVSAALLSQCLTNKSTLLGLMEAKAFDCGLPLGLAPYCWWE